MSLDIHDQMPLARPLLVRPRKSREEHFIDLRVVNQRHFTQQCFCQLLRELIVCVLNRALQIATVMIDGQWLYLLPPLISPVSNFLAWLSARGVSFQLRGPLLLGSGLG